MSKRIIKIVLLICICFCNTACVNKAEKSLNLFTGSKNDYTYNYTDEVNLNREKAVIEIADKYFAGAGCYQLYNGEVEYQEIESLEDFKTSPKVISLYDENIYQKVLDSVNSLIAKIPELSNEQFRVELRLTFNQLNSHDASIKAYSDLGIPLNLEPVEFDGQLACFINGASEEYSDLLGSALLKVNDLSISELVDRVTNYYPDYVLFYGIDCIYILSSEFLEREAVIEGAESSVTLTCVDQNGNQFTKEVEFAYDFWKVERVIYQYPKDIKDSFTETIYLLETPDEGLDFVAYDNNKNLVYSSVSKSIMQGHFRPVLSQAVLACNKHPEVNKLIIDLCGVVGEEKLNNYVEEFFDILGGIQNENVEIVFVVDEATEVITLSLVSLYQRLNDNVRVCSTSTIGTQKSVITSRDYYETKNIKFIYGIETKSVMDVNPGHNLIDEYEIIPTQYFDKVEGIKTVLLKLFEE